MAGPRIQKQLDHAPTPSDQHEDKALDRAAVGLAKFMAGGGHNSRSLAAVAISEWIIARTSLAVSGRVGAELLLFNLKDARLRGMVEAGLPSIAAALSHIDPSTPLFELEKEDVIDVFLAGIQAVNEAAVTLKETPFTSDFSDPIPFGDP